MQLEVDAENVQSWCALLGSCIIKHTQRLIHTQIHSRSHLRPGKIAVNDSFMTEMSWVCVCVCVCVFVSIIGLGTLWVISALTESLGSVLGSFNACNALPGDLDNIHTHF